MRIGNTDKAIVLDALVAAYENASRQMLSSEDIELGHRSGVRDVAVRLGIYSEFVEKMDAEKEDRPDD